MTLAALLLALSTLIGVPHEPVSRVVNTVEPHPRTTVDAATTLLLGSIGTPAEAVRGGANYADASHGSRYLAMRLPRGSVVDIHGPGGDWLGAVVNDYGPKNRRKVADIALVHWAKVCGVAIERAASVGVCTVTVEIRSRGPVELPPTDTAP